MLLGTFEGCTGVKRARTNKQNRQFNSYGSKLLDTPLCQSLARLESYIKLGARNVDELNFDLSMTKHDFLAVQTMRHNINQG